MQKLTLLILPNLKTMKRLLKCLKVYEFVYYNFESVFLRNVYFIRIFDNPLRVKSC